MEISVLHRQGKGIREIARATGLSRNTVRAVLRGEHDDVYGPRLPRPTKLSAHEDYLRGRLSSADNHGLVATALFREIQERGYSGGMTQLKLLLARLRPPRKVEPIVRFETLAGEQLQIDFVVFRRGDHPLRAFTASLGYSRMSYVEFVDNERVETWIGCLENALIRFGGVPRTVLCDNPKAIVLERNAYGNGRHRFHPMFNDFAGHYGFAIKLCRPYRAQTKGKVERFHRYLRESFYRPLESRLGPVPVDVATANREVRLWLDGVANVRMHATLKERPCDRFGVERASLAGLPLPYGGKRLQQRAPVSHSIVVPIPFESIQHSLSVYAELAAEVMA